MQRNFSNIPSIRGFSLIELVVVIAIVGILASVALPAYTDYIRKSRRADGISAIMDLHLEQKKWRGNHTTYGTLNDLWGARTLSTDQHYALEIVNNTATGYTITATPQGDQANDPCLKFVLTVSGETATKTISGAIPTDRCWQQ